jgi:hypothetical protein
MYAKPFSPGKIVTSPHQDNSDYFLTFFNAIPAPAFTVNEAVRIQNCNRIAWNLFGPFGSAVLDKRGGDVLHCVHATETPEGCGHSPDCGKCLIRNSVTEAMDGTSVFRQPTSVHLIDGQVVVERDLLVTASPFKLGGRGHVLLVLEDITEQKRAEAIRQDWQRLWGVIEAVAAEAQALTEPLRVMAETVHHFREMDSPGDAFSERVAAQEEALRQGLTLVDSIQRLTRLEPRPAVGVSTIIDLDQDPD